VQPRLAAVSVDLDGINRYQEIHGLPSLPEGAAAANAVYEIALERMHAFARSHDLPLSLFAIGEDLERPTNAAALKRLVGLGHAVENHSYSHRYDLTRLSSNEIRDDIEKGQTIIQAATGVRPTGFRAPGYTLTDDVLDALEALSFRFDSSVFPCPAYFTAKALVLGSLALVGRTSASVLDTPAVLTAPTRPYRPGKPWFKRGTRSLVELPVQVTRGLRLPFIGTSIALAGAWGARLLARACVGEPLVNLELHGIDFLDATDGLSHLVAHQPELRISLEKRLNTLSAAIGMLKKHGYCFERLDEAATRFSR